MAADPDSPARYVTQRQFDQLKDIIADQQQRIKQLQQRPAVLPETLEALGLDTPTGRRQAMKYAGGAAALPTLAALAMTEPARADAVAADVGTQADPWRTGFFAALNAGDGQQFTDWETGFNTHAATIDAGTTTDGEHFIDVDTSVAGVTVTLATADTVLGHYIVIRQNGANDVTIDTEGSQNIDGSASKTLSHDGAMIILWSDGSNWFSNEFIDRVDAGTVATDSATIDGDPAGGFGTTSSIAPGFGSWTTADADRPAYIIVEGRAETDGSTPGTIVMDIDVSGGTTADFTYTIARADPGLGNGGENRQTIEQYVPAGAQYQIRNVADPNNNALQNPRQLTL